MNDSKPKSLADINFSILDLAAIKQDRSINDTYKESLQLAQHAEQWGYKRFWLAEHHSMESIASSATAVMIGYIAGGTNTIRVGSGGIMLPNHSPLTIVSFPFQFKFNSDRIGNFRTYLLGGIKYDLDLSSNSQARNAEDLVKLNKSDFGVEAGIGFNFFMRFVTFSPELKISNGLSNIHSRDPNLKYSNVLDKLQSRMLVFSIILED